jgi:hypothetical protein
MYTFYIDIPPDRYADPVLQDLDFHMSFVCNHLSGIGQGAVFRIECDSEAAAVAFLLQTGFGTISAEQVAARQTRASGVEQIVPLSLQTEVGQCSNYSFADWPLRQDHARRS